ncbi:MAG TPA: hypothetical protein VFC19_47305 [Candidatus Limnocylindrales bacterium]|nr:hypothetical protein [Candidatus Limnocylindrales bacterium]
MPESRYRHRNLLVAVLAAICGTVAAAVALPVGALQASTPVPATGTLCLAPVGDAAQMSTPIPSSPPSPCPTPTGEPNPTGSPIPTPPPTVSPSPSPPPGCPPLGDPPDVYERQLPLLDASDHIDDTARGPVGPGYAGITIDVFECRIDVYWKGPLPSPVAAVVSIYNGPINVVVHEDAPYESAQLEPGADSLVNDPGLAAAAGVVLVGVGWPQDGTRVTAGVLATEPPPDLAAAEAFLSGALAVPVDLTIEEPYQDFARNDDRAPWYPGGRIKIPVGRDEVRDCSAGWGIRIGRDETPHLLTAAHCGARGDRVDNGDQTRRVGTIDNRNTDLDSAIIGVTSAGGRMFTGRPTANTSLPIQRADVVRVGAFVCDSGASTGQNCDIEVDAVNERIRTGVGWVRTTTTTHRNRNGIAGGTGDSGGPVYIPVDRETRVRAIGIVVAGRNPVPCRRDDDTTECGRRMAFVPIDPLLRQWNGTLITG